MGHVSLALAISMIGIAGWFGCAKHAPEQETPVVVERDGDIAYVSLRAPGFDRLSLQDRRIAYHLARAATAGRDLAYDQSYPHCLEIRNLLEEIVVHPRGISWEVLGKITRFLKRFWTETGQYDIMTSRKFVPEFTYQELVTAADSSFANGAQFEVSDQALLHARLENLRKTLFDPNFQPIKTNRSPQPPDDIVTGSAVNFYSDVTLREAEEFQEEYPLNSRLVRDAQGIREEVYRAGSPDVPPGRMASTIANVIEELDQARLLARPSQREVLTHLIEYLQTGDPKAFRDANIAWVKDQSPVDFTIGFVEVYDDPRGQKGTYEGIAYFVDSTRTKVIEQLAALASTYEELAPWDPAYKRTEPAVITGRAVNLLTAVGDGGPICATGINLPNDESIRATYGSKSVILTNVEEGYNLVWGNAFAREFAENDLVFQQWEKWGEITDFLMVAMHEIIGHGSGRLVPELQGTDADPLGEYASTLEEARADLVALYFIMHPKSREMGIVPDVACGEAAYRNYARGDLVSMVWAGNLDHFVEDHDRDHHMIVEYLRHVTGAIDTLRKDNKLYLVVTDLQKMQQGVGELLAKVMKIKATGDYQGAKQLIDTYGVALDTTWRNQVQARVHALNLPIYVAFVMPELTQEALPLGRVTDVKISYPRDFVAQMLTYSGKIPQPPKQ